jgi:hypothetical protein
MPGSVEFKIYYLQKEEFLGKLVVAQLSMKCSAFYGIRMVITVFNRVRPKTYKRG